MTAVEFVLVQHGEKDRDVAHLADPGLTQRGREQARLTGVRLRALGVRRIVASPQRRAYETASFAAQALGSGVPPRESVAVETDARLRERMNWGSGRVRQTLQEFLADWARATADRDYVPPSGDSSRATGDRIFALLEELARAPQDAPAALVTHGGATADLLRTLLGDDRLRALHPDIVTRGVPGCALTHLSREPDGRYLVVTLASVEHLPPSLRTDWRALASETHAGR